MKALTPKGNQIHLIFKVLKPKINEVQATLIILDTER